ncbi:hypothetical protein [Syntrophorhabdus aromaticivorans]|jgi:hypothetical protein|uniref:hypothetical protein n=1 Tax=Syntrophorhabdus aromaticivorans TaxID=328301 RepID=UPI00041129CE|nr:hypothetical protein [Syntrophorhabdus aromaticivorans]
MDRKRQQRNPSGEEFIKLKERFDAVTNELKEVHRQWSTLGPADSSLQERNVLIRHEGKTCRRA